MSGQRQIKHAKTSANVTEINFFFESTDPSWGTKEWNSCFLGPIPEGPALLVLYRRGGNGGVFGIVSMTNRAWTHIVPILDNALIADSTRAKELHALQMKSLGGAAIGAIAGAAIAHFTLGLGGMKTAKKVSDASGGGGYKEVTEKIEAAVRSFMFRISRDADQYWAGGRPGDGRL